MKKLYIEFIDNYYSFKKGEKLLFKGDFIILSGLNGTGKTQLLNAMAKPYKEYLTVEENLSTKYFAIIKQDDEIIDSTEIRLLNFSENLKYKNKIKNLNVQDINYKIEDIFQVYRNIAGNKWNGCFAEGWWDFKLNNLGKAAYLHYNNRLEDVPRDNWKEIRNLVELIKKTFPEGKWYSLNKDEIKMMLLSTDFEWTHNIVEEQKLLYHIANVFLTYAKKIDIAKKECINHKDKSLNHNEFDDNEWKNKAPWTRLNNLFKKLKFKYRFLEDYHINLNDGGLDEQIILKDEDSNEDRQLFDLSDGEKTLLDLALHSFDANWQKIKLVLFDEYDAFLNPSMIDKVWTILKEFYKDIQIVFVTHRFTSIFQAPKKTKFYEIFFTDGKHEVNLIPPNLYSDINHFLRWLKLDDRSDLSKCKLIIISEGHNNVHLEHILYNIYGVPKCGDIHIINGRGAGELFDNYAFYKKFGKKILFVWDPDVTEEFISNQFKKHNVKVDNKNFKFKFDKNDNSRLTDDENKGIESLYDYDEEAWKNCSVNNKINKKKTVKYVLKQTNQDFFKNFKPFVEEVKKILQSN